MATKDVNMMTEDELKLYFSGLSAGELSFIAGRYLGPHNLLLFAKNFGERTSRSRVAAMIKDELFEREVLSEPIPDKK